jgi:hypothetical protein
LALLLIVAGGAWFVLGAPGTSGNTATSSSASRSTARPTGIFLDPANFIGHPEADVRKELTDAGLVVVSRPADRAMLVALDTSLDPDDVAGLNPKNVQAKPGDTVTLYVARNGFTPGGATTAPTSAQPTTTAPRTSATSAPPTTAATTAPTTPTTAPTTPTVLPTSVASGSSAPPPLTDTSAAAGAAGTGGAP